MRRGRDLGEPSARATFGGGLSLTWLPETYYTAGIRRDRHLNFYGNRADLARHPPRGWRMHARGPLPGGPDRRGEFVMLAEGRAGAVVADRARCPAV